MKIVFDNLIFSWQKMGGISIFWSKIIELATQRIPQEDVIFYEYPKADLNFVRKNIQLPQSQLRFFPNIWFSLQRYLNVSLAQISTPFIFHSSYYRICRNPKAINVITIHDFTYEKYTKGWTRRIHIFHKYQALRKADFIVCISKNTRQDLFHYLPEIDKNKVAIIHNGVSEIYRKLSPEDFPNPPQLPQNFLLFVGSRAPYKQFDFSVKVAGSSGLPLVVVGSPLSAKEEEKLKSYNVNYISKTFPTDQELCYYYNHATALLYPSEYEGFGIPVIEAQRCGCPVLAYNASSIPEVIGDSPLLLDELHLDKALPLLLRLLQEESFRNEVIRKGLENAKQFSWIKMQDQYLTLYQKLWEKNTP